MSIRPVSTDQAPQTTNTEPLTPNIPPRTTRDTLRSYPEITSPLNSQSKSRSPLVIVCDLIECIRYFIVSQLDKMRKFFFPCLSKPPQNPVRPPVAPNSTQPGISPHLIPEVSVAALPISVPPLPLTPPDPAAGAVVVRRSIPDTEATEDLAFRALPITDSDKATIKFIVNTLARVIALPSAELERRGDEIRHIHPFTFWEYVLTQPDLTEDVKMIRSRFFGLIWAQFTEGCTQKLQAMDEQGLLAPHVNAFARSIRRDPEELRDLMGRSWIEFLNNLIDSRREAREPSPTIERSMRPDRDSDSGATTLSSHTQGSTDPYGSTTGQLLSIPVAARQTTGTVFSPQGYTTGRAAAQKVVSTITMTSDQRQKLNRLLTDISQNSPIILGFQLASLKNDWFALRDVHPLRVLWELFNNPTHIAKLDLILNNTLKKGYFLTDFANALKAGARDVELRLYFQDFASGMGIQQDSLERLIAGGHYEWTHLIRYLHNLKKTAAVASTV